MDIRDNAVSRFCSTSSHNEYWIYKSIFALSFLFVLVAAVTLILLGIPNHPKTISLTSFESRLIQPNQYYHSSILVSDPEGGLNSFFLNTEPKTYFLKTKLEQELLLPRGHYKYWARHLNRGSRIKLHFEWNHDISAKFCMAFGSLEDYLKSNSNCLVTKQAKNRISLEHIVKQSGEHFFIIESSQDSLQPSNVILNTRSISSISISSILDDLEQRNNQIHKNEDSQKFTKRSLNALNADPEFFIARGNVSFEMDLLQYDTNQADDLYVGSFSKDFQFGSQENIVLFNPSSSKIYSITITLSRRYRELVLISLLIEFVLISAIATCWLKRLNHMSLIIDHEMALAPHKRMHPKNGLLGTRRHMGETRSKNMDDREAPMIDFKPRFDPQSPVFQRSPKPNP